MLQKIFLLFLLGVLLLPAGMVSAGKSTEAQDKQLYPVVKNGKWGYIDAQGVLVIKPRFENADYFNEGLAPVKLNKKVGYINLKGEMVIEPQFDDGWEFKSGVAGVKIGGNLGYINREGKYIWNPNF